MKRLTALLLSAIMLVSLLAGCGSSNEQTVAPEGGEQSTQTITGPGKVNGDIVIVTQSDVVTFDPDSSLMQVQLVAACIYARLYEDNENFSGQPELAESVTQESDTSFLIKIYEGVKFSDGSDLDSEDVVASLNRARESTNGKTLLAPITNIEAVDPYTIRITTDGVFPSLTTALSQSACSILPKEYLEEVAVSGDWSNPVCSGRYTVKEKKLGDYVTLVKNDGYFNKDDMAQNNSLTIKVIPEGVNRTIMVESGEADLNMNFLTADYDRVMNNPALKLHENASATKYYVAMDTQNEYFSNVKVRQAVNYALDRDSILLAGFDGLGAPLYSCFSPSSKGYLEHPGDYTYNVEKAKSLMAEAGYADGFSTDLYVWNDTLQRIAEVVQAYLSQIGITAEIKRIETSVRAETSTSGAMSMCVGSWTDYEDPDLFAARLYGRSGIGGSNYARFDNDEFEKLYVEGKSTYVESERVTAYQEMQKVLAEEAPWAPIFVARIYALANAELQGVEMSTQSAYHFHMLHY